MMRIIILFCVVFLGIQTFASARTFVYRNANADLNFIEHLLETKYAPKPWKEKRFGWDLARATEHARLQLFLEEDPTVKYCQRVLAEYISGLNDYHAGVTFFSTARSYLPYVVKLSSSGRCYVVDSYSPYSDILVHDEILEVDGVPISEVLAGLRCGDDNAANRSIAARTLFSRSASLGHVTPTGGIILKVRRPSGIVRTVRTKWRHIPEGIQDLSLISPLIKDTRLSCRAKNPSCQIQNSRCLFTNAMVPYFWGELRSQYKSRGVSSNYDLGNKKGFLPEFPGITWVCQDGPYHAYVFTCFDALGQRHDIGYLRIATYSWSDMEDLNEETRERPWEDLEGIIGELEERTQGLIIDQTNNPGGSVFYLYGILSMLTGAPLDTPKHRMILTQDEVSSALRWLDLLEGVDTDREAIATLGETMEGYAVNANAAGYLQSFSNDILECWKRGDINLTPPIPLLGFAQIHPHPRVQYTHPICVLINEENFSCGDLFPAIMKDNNRAVIVGTTTAGAGGFVFNVDFPNRTGIKHFSLTGSLAVRKNGILIENVGVSPHIYLPLTDVDVQSGRYPDYMQKVKAIILEMISEQEKVQKLKLDNNV